jgi:hypothetical protein
MDGLGFAWTGPNAWNNILFCGLCYLSTNVVPILGVIVIVGFLAEIHRRLVLRHPEPYLRFDFADLGPYLSRGVIVFVMNIVMMLPLAVLGVVETFVFFGVMAAIGSGSASDAGTMLLGVFGAAAIVTFPILLVWYVLGNAATTRAELTGDFSKSLVLGKLWSFGAKTWKRVFVTGLLMSLIGFGLFMLGLIACFIGVFVALPILMIAGVHVRWQIYNEYLLEGGEPIELAPWETLPSEIKPPQYGAPPPRGAPAPFQPPPGAPPPYGAPPPPPYGAPPPPYGAPPRY